MRLKGFNERDFSKYKGEYSDKKLIEKLNKAAKKAGTKVIYAALVLYYTLKAPNVPNKVKGVILGALGYLILPVDVIPDLIPMAGFTDDLGVLLAAISYVGMYIYKNPGIRLKARSKLAEILGDFDEGGVNTIEGEIIDKDGR